MTPSDLLVRHGVLWREATQHRFLDGIREGRLPAGAVDTWLAQDARFASDLLTFQARLLARAPRPAQAALATGAVALVDELAWFESLSARRGLDLTTRALPATEAYADLLRRLDTAAYPIAITALWLLERVYLEAWRSAAPGAPEYRELVEHWTTPDFAAYVSALETLAALIPLPSDDAGVDATALEVLECERAFWDEALAADPAP